MPRITIDDIEFNSEDLSESAKLQLDSLKYLDNEMQKLETELSILKISKMIYSREMKRNLDAVKKEE